jgi:hypothetical protein
VTQAEKQDDSEKLNKRRSVFSSFTIVGPVEKEKWAVKKTMCKMYSDGQCRKGVYCTYMHCKEDYGKEVRDWEGEGYKIELCRYHWGFGNHKAGSCSKGEDCEWAHSYKDTWSRGGLKTTKDSWKKVVDRGSGQVGQSIEARRVKIAETRGRFYGENVPSSSNFAKDLMQKKIQMLEETAKGMISKELTLLGHQHDPTPTTLPPVTMNRQLDAGLMKEEEAGEKESQVEEEGAAAAEVTTEETGSPHNVRHVAFKGVEKEDYGEEEEMMMSGTGFFGTTVTTVMNMFSMPFGKEGPKEAASGPAHVQEPYEAPLPVMHTSQSVHQPMRVEKAYVQHLAARAPEPSEPVVVDEEGAVAVAATEEEATRQSPSS